jgi:hypothetical protein
MENLLEKSFSIYGDCENLLFFGKRRGSLD